MICLLIILFEIGFSAGDNRSIALVKHIVDGSENHPNGLYGGFSSCFAKNSTPVLERSDRRDSH